MYKEERHRSFLPIGTHSLEITRRGIGLFAAVALPGDDEEGSDKGSNGDADDDALLGEHCAGSGAVSLDIPLSNVLVRKKVS